MSETSSAGTTQVPPQTGGPGETSTSQPGFTPTRRADVPEPTAWVGWIMFGSVMLIMMGMFQIIAGITALVRSGYYVVGSNDLLVSVDYTGWGWVHIAIGVLALAAAFGLLNGQMWARVVAIGIALVSALVNMAFVAAYPLWSLTIITLDVIVIYAVAMHGAELKNRRA